MAKPATTRKTKLLSKSELLNALADRSAYAHLRFPSTQIDRNMLHGWPPSRRALIERASL